MFSRGATTISIPTPFSRAIKNFVDLQFSLQRNRASPRAVVVIFGCFGSVWACWPGATAYFDGGESVCRRCLSRIQSRRCVLDEV